MTIPPALTAEEWAEKQWARGENWADARHGLSAGGDYAPFYGNEPGDYCAIIALANDALPDDDERKITREWVRDIHESALLALDAIRLEYGAESQWGDVPKGLAKIAKRAIANATALQSYLPPE